MTHPASKSPTPMALGPFDLEVPVGVGGMGQVWRGRHRQQGIPVAIKVLTEGRLWRAPNLEAFQYEVRAMAGLHHRGVAVVFDHGLLPRPLAEASQGRLKAGQPYLVMEYASGGTLEAFEGKPLPWSLCRAIAIELLDALAHAHARGVIHRDIKPGNVLLAGAGDLRPGLKLTDFGIARIFRGEDRSDREEVSVGTPQYMAPEQFEGRWQDQGPWTDLYALGVVLWTLVTGKPPFEAPSVVELAYHHMMTPLPRLETPTAKPSGLERWLRRLMAKDPRTRFQRAADAAARLMELPAPDIEVIQDLPGALADMMARHSPAPASNHHTHTLTSPTATTVGLATAGPAPPSDPALHAPLPGPPPLPTAWQRREETPSLLLQGVGSGVYGLRNMAMVGRKEARDALWDLLHKVKHEGRTHAAILRGSAGVGKSRLARWLCERAHEVGAATILLARHSDTPGPGQGVSGMLARHLRCLGHEHDAVWDRCEDVLSAMGQDDDAQWQALAEVIAPTPSATPTSTHFGTPAERYAVVRRFLEQLSTARPVLLWLDDVQWGVDAMGLAGHLLKQRDRSPHPILVILTARNEALADNPVARWTLRELASMDGAHRQDLEPLTESETTTLIQRSLALEPGLARQVCARSGGNPLFAVQLIGDWVTREVLTSGPDGFELLAGEDAPLPADLHAVWRDRVQRLVEGLSTETHLSLELAAVLGVEVRSAEWHQACHMAGIKDPQEGLDRLFAMRLAVAEDGGWRFAHAMLRESLLSLAKHRKTLAGLHALCARSIGQTSPQPDHPKALERRGRHLLGAGETDEAGALLFKATRRMLEVHALEMAWSPLDAFEQALKTQNAPESDPRWGQSWLLRARLYSYQVNLSEALRWNRHALHQGCQHGWDAIIPQALRGLGDTERLQGNLLHAAAHYEEALKAFEERGEEAHMAACLNGIGATAQQRGELDEATTALERALGLWESQGNQRSTAQCLTLLAHIAQSRQDTDRWATLSRRALDIYEALGDRLGLAVGYNELAEIARAQGQLKEAEEGYRKAAALCAALGQSTDIIQLNLGLVLIGRGRFEQAGEQIRAATRAMEEGGRQGFLVFADAALLACAAATADKPLWDTCWTSLLERQARSGIIDPDLAWCVQIAADHARTHGWHPQAQQSQALYDKLQG